MEDRDSQGTIEQRGRYGSSGGGGYGGARGYGGDYGGRGRGGYGARPFRPTPVKVGEEFDVKIESMSKRGDAGVAKVEGLVIFIAGTKIGDSVRIRITKVGRGYATAEIATTSQTQSEHSAVESSGSATGGEEYKDLSTHEGANEQELM